MSTRFIAGFDPVCQDLLKALGFEGKNVKDFSLHFPIDDAATLNVEMLLTEDQVEACVEALKEYHIEVVENVPFADGGIPTGPSVETVGDQGPEKFLPLDDLEAPE